MWASLPHSSRLVFFLRTHHQSPSFVCFVSLWPLSIFCNFSYVFSSSSSTTGEKRGEEEEQVSRPHTWYSNVSSLIMFRFNTHIINFICIVGKLATKYIITFQTNKCACLIFGSNSLSIFVDWENSAKVKISSSLVIPLSILFFCVG